MLASGAKPAWLHTNHYALPSGASMKETLDAVCCAGRLKSSTLLWPSGEWLHCCYAVELVNILFFLNSQ